MYDASPGHIPLCFSSLLGSVWWEPAVGKAEELASLLCLLSLPAAPAPPSPLLLGAVPECASARWWVVAGVVRADR